MHTCIPSCRLKRSCHSCPWRWMPTTKNAPCTHCQQRWNVTAPVEKWSQKKISPKTSKQAKMVYPEAIAGNTEGGGEEVQACGVFDMWSSGQLCTSHLCVKMYTFYRTTYSDILLMHMNKNMDVFAFAVRCWNKINGTGYCMYFMSVIIW